MDRLSGLALTVADHVLGGSAAGPPAGGDTTAILFASSYGCHKSDEEFWRSVAAGSPSPRLFAYTLPSSPAGEVSIHHQLCGPSVTIVSGRTAGIEALGEAQRYLAAGAASRCLVIGCEVALPCLPEHGDDGQLHDAACAVLLEVAVAPGGTAAGELVAVAEAFCPGDPGAALRQAVGALSGPSTGPAALFCDPQSAPWVIASLGPPQVVELAQAGAAAALVVLATLPLGRRAGTDCLLLSVDPSGQAAVAKWRPRS
jgi:hypothetical protein